MAANEVVAVLTNSTDLVLEVDVPVGKGQNVVGLLI
jgi:hypothetical protein